MTKQDYTPIDEFMIEIKKYIKSVGNELRDELKQEKKLKKYYDSKNTYAWKI